MKTTLKVKGYTCDALHFNTPGTPIVLLHGLSYTSKVWQSIKLINPFVEKKVPFLALDMPYGLKSRCTPKTRDPNINITFANEAIKTVFGSAVPILVGASLGGYMALKYAAKYPVRGLFLIAPPYHSEADLVKAYGKFNFPIRIVWGSYDSIVSSEEMRALTGMLPNSKLLVYNGAGHSAYNDLPEQFKQDLLQLYITAEQTQP